MSKEKISILGCGWLGLPLGKYFADQGFSVKGSVTNPLKFDLLQEAEISPFRIVLTDFGVEYDDVVFFDSDVLIIAIPPGRGSGNALNFPLRIKNLVPFIQKAEIRKVIFISSTSVYPDNFQAAKENELAIPDKESGLALLQTENLLISETRFKTTILRFGGLIGADRNPARFVQKSTFLIPDAPVNLIHQDDCVEIISEIVRQEIWGETFNACCPEHPMKGDFYRKAAQISGFPEPMISKVKGPHKIVDSSKLIDRLKYRFIFPSPMDYLEHINKPEEQ